MSDNIVKAAADRTALLNVLQSLLMELEVRFYLYLFSALVIHHVRASARMDNRMNLTPLTIHCLLRVNIFTAQDKGTYKCLTQFVHDADERERTMQETIERERAETARVRALKQQLKQEREEHEEARCNSAPSLLVALSHR